LRPAGTAESTTHLAVVSPDPKTIELFWIGKDDSVQSLYWDNDAFLWSAAEVAPASSASSFGRVDAALIGGQTLVAWVGRDGDVQTALGGRGWWLRGSIPGSHALPQSSVEIVDDAGKAQIFWAGADRSVETCRWWFGGGKLQRVAAPGSVSASGAITAIKYAAIIEAFWIAPDRAVRAWNMNTGASYQLAEPGSASIAGGIEASSGAPGSVDVWWINVAPGSRRTQLAQAHAATAL
jgi:hypothetical protein